MSAKKSFPLLLLAVIWGVYYVASNRAVAQMSVFTVGIVIRLITMVLLTINMLRTGELRRLLDTKGVRIRLCLIGCLGFLLDFTAFLGLQLTSSAGSGTALLKTDIIFVNLISMLIYKQHFGKKEWAVSLTMLFGVLLVMGIDFRTFRLDEPADIFFVLSAFFISCNAFLIKSVQRSDKAEVSNDTIAFYNNFITMLLFTVTAVGLGTIGEIGQMAQNSGLLLALVIAGLGQTGIYIVYYYDLSRYPVWIVKVFLLLMPIVTSVISLVLFGETITLQQLAGMVIVIAGAFAILRMQNDEKALSGM